MSHIEPYLPTIDVLDYGADRTGVEDSSTAINNAIAAASSEGTGIVLLPSGTYLIESAITMASDVYLVGLEKVTLQAAASRVSTYASPWEMITISGKSRCGLRNIKLDANKANQTAEYMGDMCTLIGIDIKSSSTDVTIEDCWIIDFMYGVYGPADGSYKPRLRVTNNRITGGLIGVYLSGANDNTSTTTSQDGSWVTGNTITGCYQKAVDIYACKLMTLADNNISVIGYTGTKAARASSTAYTLGQVIYPATAGYRAYLFRCTTAGTSASSEGATWTTSTVSDGTVTWTRMDWEAALTLHLMTHSSVTGNKIYYCHYAAIQLTDDSNDNTVANNQIYNSGYTGSGSGNDKINGSPSGNGISIWKSSGACLRNVIKGNTINLPTGYGISLHDTCLNTVIANNTILNPQDPGIACLSNDTVIIGNNLEDCDGDAIVVGEDDDGAQSLTVQNVSVVGNTGYDNSKAFIYVNGGRYVSIVGNTSNKSGQNEALTAAERSGIRISRHPISSVASTYISVTGNTLIDSGQTATTDGGYGIFCDGNENYCAFYGNVITGSGTSNNIQESGANNVPATTADHNISS